MQDFFLSSFHRPAVFKNEKISTPPQPENTIPRSRPSLKSAGVDNRLQDVGSQTEEPGHTGARYLVGGALEDSGGGRWRDDRSDGCADGDDGWGCRDARLAGLRSRGESSGDWHDGADGERTLGDSESLAWGGGVDCG